MRLNTWSLQEALFLKQALSIVVMVNNQCSCSRHQRMTGTLFSLSLHLDNNQVMEEFTVQLHSARFRRGNPEHSYVWLPYGLFTLNDMPEWICFFTIRLISDILGSKNASIFILWYLKDLFVHDLIQGFSTFFIWLCNCAKQYSKASYINYNIFFLVCSAVDMTKPLWSQVFVLTEIGNSLTTIILVTAEVSRNVF